MAPQLESRYGALWQRDELILVLYLYCQIPFAQTKASNPEVIRLAHVLGRTPSAVARKLGNFGAFDPLLARKGISGLTHYAKADNDVWREFSGRWEPLVEEASRLLAAKGAERTATIEIDDAPVISQPFGITERRRLVLTRLFQSFFRRAVMSSYHNACCVCEIDLPQLLIASHIIPWSINHATRTEPQNGLCLCALHDRAFDRGLLSISASLEVLLSPVVSGSRSEFSSIALHAFQGHTIQIPSRFPPKAEYLQWHRDNIFQP
jgi:putative restriction endonuclease